MTSFMTRGIHSPVATQSPIAGKAFLDIYDIEQRKLSAKDMGNQRQYHGAKNENFQVYPHQVVIGRKDSCNVGNYAGPRCEYGLTTAAGLSIDKSPEHTMRDHYFMGIATTEVPYGGDTMYASDPIGEAFSFLRSGTVTVRWYDMEDGKPGDLICWTLPSLKDERQPGKPKQDQEFSYDNGFNPLSRHMYGEASFDNPVYYIKKCDPTDFGFQLAGSFWAMNHTKTNGGVSDVSFNNFQDTDNDLSSIQEEACGWMFGLIGAIQCLEDADINAIRLIGPNDNINVSVREALGKIFGIYTFDGDNNKQNNQKVNNEMTKHCMKHLTGSVMSAAYAKGERVIGRLTNGVRPGDDADIIMQHVKIGF